MRCFVYAFTLAFALPAALFLLGCQPATKTSIPAQTAATEPSESPDLQKLSPEDRAIAEAQGYCVVETEGRLGSMGVPIKLMIDDQPVFICCEGCKDSALADPAATLATVEELKAKVAAEKASTP